MAKDNVDNRTANKNTIVNLFHLAAVKRSFLGRSTEFSVSQDATLPEDCQVSFIEEPDTFYADDKSTTQDEV